MLKTIEGTFKMKTTKRELRRIIKEEKQKLLKEYDVGMESRARPAASEEVSMMDLDDHNRLVQQIDRIIGTSVTRGYAREDIIYALKNILEEI
jgi:hypothetical protein